MILERCLLAIAEPNFYFCREQKIALPKGSSYYKRETIIQRYLAQKFLSLSHPDAVQGLSKVCEQLGAEPFQEKIKRAINCYSVKSAIFSVLAHGNMTAVYACENPHIETLRACIQEMEKRIDRWAEFTGHKTTTGFNSFFQARIRSTSGLLNAYSMLFSKLSGEPINEEIKACLLEMCRTIYSEGELGIREQGNCHYSIFLSKLASSGVSLAEKVNPHDENSCSLFVAHLLQSDAFYFEAPELNSFLTLSNFVQFCKSFSDVEFTNEMAYLKSSRAWHKWFIRNETYLRHCVGNLKRKQENAAKRPKKITGRSHGCCFDPYPDNEIKVIQGRKPNPNRAIKINFLNALIDAGENNIYRSTGASCSSDESGTKRQRCE